MLLLHLLRGGHHDALGSLAVEMVEDVLDCSIVVVRDVSGYLTVLWRRELPLRLLCLLDDVALLVIDGHHFGHGHLLLLSCDRELCDGSGLAHPRGLQTVEICLWRYRTRVGCPAKKMKHCYTHFHMSQYLQSVNQIGQLRAAVAEVHNRLVAVERREPDAPPTVSPVPAEPSPAVDVEKLTRTLEAHLSEGIRKGNEQVISEVRGAACKDKAALETTLSHKMEQLVAKLVRERVEQGLMSLRGEMEQLLEQKIGQVVMTTGASDAPAVEVDDIEITMPATKSKRGGAKKAIEAAGGRAISIVEAAKKHPTGKDVLIIK